MLQFDQSGDNTFVRHPTRGLVGTIVHTIGLGYTFHLGGYSGTLTSEDLEQISSRLRYLNKEFYHD